MLKKNDQNHAFVKLTQAKSYIPCHDTLQEQQSNIQMPNVQAPGNAPSLLYFFNMGEVVGGLNLIINRANCENRCFESE